MRLLNEFEETKYISLKLPVQTRWNSFVLSLECWLKTKFALKILAVEDNDAIQNALKTSNNEISVDFLCGKRWKFEIVTPVAKWTTLKNTVTSNVVNCSNEIIESLHRQQAKFPIKKALSAYLAIVESRRKCAKLFCQRLRHKKRTFKRPSVVGGICSSTKMA